MHLAQALQREHQMMVGDGDRVGADPAPSLGLRRSRTDRHHLRADGEREIAEVDAVRPSQPQGERERAVRHRLGDAQGAWRGDAGSEHGLGVEIELGARNVGMGIADGCSNDGQAGALRLAQGQPAMPIDGHRAGAEVDAAQEDARVVRALAG